MSVSTIRSPGVAGMLEGYSIEVNPGDAKVVDAAVDRLDQGTEVSLTWIAGADPFHMTAAAAKLRRGGLISVPHVAARHLESSAQLEGLAARLADEAGVDRILLVGGDREKPAGPYDSSLAVMQTGVFQKAGIVRMTIGGFPEGNPHVTEAIARQAIPDKVAFARSDGIRLSIVTQFCFKAEPILEWLREIRAQGIYNPVRVGVAGPAGLITLTRYAIRCGIGNSLHVLTDNPTFAKLLLEKGPEPIIRGIAAAAHDANADLGIAGLHFYVFGGFKKTVDWINAARGVQQPSAQT